MMSPLLAFAGSNSSTSINFKLVAYTVSLIAGHPTQLLDMAHLALPMYSADSEKNQGFPVALIALKKDIEASKGILVSVNEHNGNPSAFFKNRMDWLSRLDKSFLQDKKVLLMATTPGKRGAMGAMEVVQNMLPHFGANIVATFSLTSFYGNFSDSDGIKGSTLAKVHREALDAFLTKILFSLANNCFVYRIGC